MKGFKKRLFHDMKSVLRCVFLATVKAYLKFKFEENQFFKKPDVDNFVTF